MALSIKSNMYVILACLHQHWMMICVLKSFCLERLLQLQNQICLWLSWFWIQSEDNGHVFWWSETDYSNLWRNIFFCNINTKKKQNVILSDSTFKFKSNLSLYSLYYAEACSKSAWPISASLHPGNTASFEKMLLWWRAVGSTVSDLTGPRFACQTSRSRDELVTARPTGRFASTQSLPDYPSFQICSLSNLSPLEKCRFFVQLWAFQSALPQQATLRFYQSRF